MLSYPDFKEKNIAIIFNQEGQKFAIKNSNLIIKDKDDNLILQTTCHKLLALWIVGQCTITSGLLTTSKKFGFPILLLSSQFRCIGAWHTPTDGNFLLRKMQYQYHDLAIAKHLISNKMHNQIALLKSLRKKSIGLKTGIEQIQQYLSQVDSASSLQEMMGLEGIASKCYFSYWFETLPYQGRRPRTKQDPINVLMDIGYTQLFYFIENMLNLYGFDIYQGVLHRNFYQRKSLICDIQEPFRCIIDKKIRSAYHLKQFKEEDFELVQSQYRLKWDKNKEYTQWILKTILSYKAEIFLYCQAYYRAFIRQKPISEFPVFHIESSQKSQ